MNRRDRRRFLRGGLALAGLGLLSGCGLVTPPWQASPKVPRIGVISGQSAEVAAAHFGALRQGLGEHGYQEGHNVLVEWRYLEGRTERAPEVVDELVRLGVAALVIGNPAAVQAARRATDAVPIVLAGVFPDPVGQGIIAGLNRPGGNVTGLSLRVPTLGGKRLELLKETVPAADRIAVLWDRTLGAVIEPAIKPHEELGRSLGLELRPFFVERADELDGAFETMRRDGAGAIDVTDGPLTVSHARRIADLALQHRLPAIYSTPAAVRAGGMMALGVDQADLYRRAAGYVDKILRGADPAELPVEQPTKFDFVINLKTARALGLSIPQPVLLQATELID